MPGSLNSNSPQLYSELTQKPLKSQEGSALWKMKSSPSIVQAWVRGATESIEVSTEEAVAVWYGNIETTLTQPISTGDLAQAEFQTPDWNQLSEK